MKGYEPFTSKVKFNTIKLKSVSIFLMVMRLKAFSYQVKITVCR